MTRLLFLACALALAACSKSDDCTHWPDADGDGWGDPEGEAVVVCNPGEGYADNDQDCDDTTPLLGGEELCDLVDNDCDGEVDEGEAPLALDGEVVDSLQALIDAAEPGATVPVCEGTYAGGVVIENNLTLRGAGTDRSTLEGGAPVIWITGGEVTLEGLRIRGGSGTNPDPEEYEDVYGGGVLAYDAERLTLSGCLVEDNSADRGGGVAALSLGALHIEDSTITGNTASLYGGGVSIERTEATLSGAVISDNNASEAGGLRLFSSDVSMVGAEIRDNQATYGGGVVLYGEGDRLAGVNSVVEGNSAEELGGGVLLAASSALEGLTIQDNDARFGGGVFLHKGSVGAPHQLDGVEVVENRADYGGGVYFVWPGALVDTWVERNSADVGGGLRSEDSYHSALEITIDGGGVRENSADVGGGAHFFQVFRLTVTESDWGEGATENYPDDVVLHDGKEDSGSYNEFGNTASFTCANDEGCR